jgi:hypothetical protein
MDARAVDVEVGPMRFMAVCGVLWRGYGVRSCRVDGCGPWLSQP